MWLFYSLDTLCEAYDTIYPMIPDPLPPHRLTPRDEQVIEMVFLYAGCSADAVHQRFFAGTTTLSACYRRLRLLIAHQYLSTQRLSSLSGLGSGKWFLTVGPKAHTILAPRLGLSREEVRPRLLSSSLLAEHHFAICFFRLCVERAAESLKDVALIDWTLELVLRRSPVRVKDTYEVGNQQLTRTITLVADGAFLLAHGQREQRFALEQDMGTVSLKRVQTKIRGYLRHQARESAPTPVLYITSSVARQEAIIAAALVHAKDLGAKPSQIFATTQTEIAADTVLTEPIWHQAGRGEPVAIVAQPEFVAREVSAGVPSGASVWSSRSASSSSIRSQATG